MRRLAQGHLDTLLGGAGDRTGNLTVTSQLTLTEFLTSNIPMVMGSNFVTLYFHHRCLGACATHCGVLLVERSQTDGTVFSK